MKAKDHTLAATILQASKAQQKTAADVGLKAAEVRALVAIAALSEEYPGFVEVRTLHAAQLAAPTRLREQVAALVQAGYAERKRRHRRHCLLITEKGRKVVADCLRTTRRAIDAFLHL